MVGGQALPVDEGVPSVAFADFGIRVPILVGRAGGDCVDGAETSRRASCVAIDTYALIAVIDLMRGTGLTLSVYHEVAIIALTVASHVIGIAGTCDALASKVNRRVGSQLATAFYSIVPSDALTDSIHKLLIEGAVHLALASQGVIEGSRWTD